MQLSKDVTAERILAAAVSEMTVFRIFGSKKAILNTVVQQYLYSEPVEQAIQEQLTYHLDADLLMISKQYHNVLRKNKQVYLISVMERNTMPEIHLNIHYNATKFLHIVTDYLDKMQQMGKVRPGNTKLQALTLIQLNYGKFVSETLLEGANSNLPEEDYLADMISVIARGLA